MSFPLQDTFNSALQFQTNLKKKKPHSNQHLTISENYLKNEVCPTQPTLWEGAPGRLRDHTDIEVKCAKRLPAECVRARQVLTWEACEQTACLKINAGRGKTRISSYFWVMGSTRCLTDTRPLTPPGRRRIKRFHWIRCSRFSHSSFNRLLTGMQAIREILLNGARGVERPSTVYDR